MENVCQQFLRCYFNPFLQVKNSKLKVKLCRKGSEGCGQKVDGNFKLPQNSTENEV